MENTQTFAPHVYEERRTRLQEAIRRVGLSGMIVVSRASRIYLTGFGPESGSLSRFVALCLPAEGLPTYIINDLDKDRTTDLEISVRPVAYGQGVGVAAEVIRSWPAGTIGVEAGSLPLLVADAIRGKSHRILTQADGILAGLRAVKTQEEIEILRQAAQHTDAVADEARRLIREGMTERELSGAMVHFAMKRGCDMPQIPLVLTGERAMMPHLLPSDQPFKSGELVVVDFGVGFGGYETDICRTYAVGEPSSFARELHAIVLEAYQAAVRMAQPGKSAEDVHTAAYDVIAAAGYGEYFIHGVGHGVGITSHESPLLAFGQNTHLEEGMVLAIEPGIYTRGVGIRLEDDVVVSLGGGETLNRTSMDL